MTRPTERQAYRERHRQNVAKLRQIDALLDVHRGTAEQFPNDGRFAGDMGRLAELLDEAIACLRSGKDGPR